MLYGINEVSIIVSAILAIAMGSVWYSPLAFGNAWMSAVGLTAEDVEATKSKMPKLFLIAGLANVGMFYVLAYLILIARQANVEVFNLSLWITALIGAVIVGAVVWEQKPLSYIFINVGYSAVVIVGGMQIIALWPW